ncbi:hypothetical protein D3C78_1209060 [compost metagenome]
MVAQRRPHQAHARADAAAVVRRRGVQQAVGGINVEAVHAQAQQYLPGVVQPDLILHVVALALDLVARIAAKRHGAVVLPGQVRVVEIQGRHGLRARPARGGGI